MSISMRKFGVTAFALMSPLATAAGGDPVCSEFARLFDAPKMIALSSMVVQPRDNTGPDRIYEGLDIDGDGAFDEVTVGCASSQPAADPCVLVVKLSTGPVREFTFRGQERVFLVRMDSKFYAATSTNRPGTRSVVSVDAGGMKWICDNL